MSLRSVTLQTDESQREQPITLIDLAPENPIPVISNNEERSSIRLK
jgi:hypothetical protein